MAASFINKILKTDVSAAEVEYNQPKKGMPMRKKSLGISLLEVLLAVVIIGLIITLSIRYFLVAQRGLRIEQSIASIKEITQASYQWLQQQRQGDFKSPKAISIDDLVSIGLIQTQMTKDSWGGLITVEPGQNEEYVKITLNNIPKVDCLGLARQIQAIAKNTDDNSCKEISNTVSGEF